jgi:hypothetical protein
MELTIALRLLVVLVGVILTILFVLYFERAKGPQSTDVRPMSCQHGAHDFRTIADPYVKQCVVKTCGVVIFNMGPKGEFPDGLKEYVNWITACANPLPGDLPHSFVAMNVDGVGNGPCSICGGPWPATIHVDAHKFYNVVRASDGKLPH